MRTVGRTNRHDEVFRKFLYGPQNSSEAFDLAYLRSQSKMKHLNRISEV